MRRSLWLFVPSLLLLTVIASSCINDPVKEPEAVPRQILRPGAAFFSARNYVASDRTGDLVVRWSPSASDTQINFKGYFVRLFESEYLFDSSVKEFREILLRQIDSARTDRSDTQYVFHNLPVRRYAAAIWGERFGDTLLAPVLSRDSAFVAFDFDPRPVFAPSLLEAASSGSTEIRLHWKASPTDSQIGAGGYHVYYRETGNTAAKGKRAAVFIRPREELARIAVPQRDQKPPYEKEYEFWVKAVRNDSTESADSVSITWAGAEQFPLGGDSLRSSSIAIDSGIFIGNINGRYDMQAIDAPQAQIIFQESGGLLNIKANNGAMFAPSSKRISIFDSSFFSEPVPFSSYTESSLTAAPMGELGYEFYVKFANGAVARIFVLSANGSLITNRRVQLRVSFQPPTLGASQLPYF